VQLREGPLSAQPRRLDAFRRRTGIHPWRPFVRLRRASRRVPLQVSRALGFSPLKGDFDGGPLETRQTDPAFLGRSGDRGPCKTQKQWHERRGSKTAGATIVAFLRISRPGIYGNCRRHLVFAICGEPHLVVGDIPGLDTNHAAPGRVAEIDHGGCLFGRDSTPRSTRRRPF
jgi:hypothetical protein